MLLVLLISILGLATKKSAAISLVPYPTRLTQHFPPNTQNISMAATDITTYLSSGIQPIDLDPRFTYEARFARQFLNKDSAYLNTLLALEDLSTKGWTQRLRWEANYSFVGYGGVIIRIHASQNPSTLQYRHAIWGLYLAIRESSANGLRACLLNLYWSPVPGKTRYLLGYVSILGPPSSSTDSGKSTDDALAPALPTEPGSKNITLNIPTSTIRNSTSIAVESTDTASLRFEIDLRKRSIDIDAIFHTIYPGIVYLASKPQSEAILQPGLIEDDVLRTFLRWDFTHITSQPRFEYRYAIAALSALPVYMYEYNRYEDARFIVYVDEIEVGRGWLYRHYSDPKQADE